MEDLKKAENAPKENGLALGIDFGNSKISGAVWNIKKKSPQIIKDPQTGSYQFPAIIYFSSNSFSQINDNKNKDKEQINIKENYKNIIKEFPEINEKKPDVFLTDKIKNSNILSLKDNLSILEPEVGVSFDINKNYPSYVYDIKKYLGLKINNSQYQELKESLTYETRIINDNLFFVINNNEISFQTLAKLLIEKIKSLAEKQFNDKIKIVAISVPHIYNYCQRYSLKKAALSTGISRVYIINDPLSTAIYYSFSNQINKSENFLIIDFGSSKLEVTILKINKNNSIKVTYSDGVNDCNGEDFNNAVEKEILETLTNGNNFFNENPDKLFKFKSDVEKAKKSLSFKPEADIINIKGKQEYKLNRENLDECIKKIENKILDFINNSIVNSGISEEILDHVILQGNASRVISVYKMIQKRFKDSDIITNLYDSVAYGSAIYAAKKIEELKEEKYIRFKLHDITPLSLGIRTEGNLMSFILKKGTRIPVKATKSFVTTQDNQTMIKFDVYEGERKLAKENRLLTKLILSDLPEMNKGEIKVEICFEIDEESILNVTASEYYNGKSVNCSANIYNTLTHEEIKELIDNAEKCLEEDNKEKDRIKTMLKLNEQIFDYIHLYENDENIRVKLETIKNWIKHNTSAPKEQYISKIEKVNEIINKKKTKIKK